MAATNGDATAALEDLKPPPGVVLPPREIRNILEKTAGYVARNGAVFEDRIRDKESANNKFSFLSPGDAYHPFYEWRLHEIRSGRGTAVAAGRANEAAEPEKAKGPAKPAEFDFSARMPRINQKDLDVIRLTALFVAQNGRQFMTQLAQRETGNPQFQFLIPNHTFHNFFQHLVDQYTALLRAGGMGGEGGRVQRERMQPLEANIKDKFHVLGRARQRAEYIKWQEQEKQKREEEEEQQKADFARVDWGDFIVVETITFSESDENAHLPPPTNLAELQYASLEERNNASIGASMRLEEAFPGEEFAQNAHMPSYPLPVHPSHGPQQPTGHEAGPPAPTYMHIDPEEEQRIGERAAAQARMQQAQAEARNAPASIKIRENYVPRAAQKQANRVQMAICPNCKQEVAMDELEAHMRIELLDPRWKEQKAKAEARHSTTNIAHVDVANNLKRLASQRSDVFDPVTGQTVSEEELARRKRAAVHDYEGSPQPGGQGQNLNVEQQIRAIHQKFAEKR